MIESIFIAETGLRGFSNGLRAISHNTANLNTPGFKGTSTLFGDLFYGGSGLTGNGGLHFGNGLNTLGTMVNFQAGQFQSTGNPLDLAVDGQGFFILQDANGNIHYTQDGQFRFNSDGDLVSSATGEKVLARSAGGGLAPININSLQNNAAKATTTITFSGNVSPGSTEATVSSITVVDAQGVVHTLSLKMVPAPSPSPAGTWNITLTEGTTTVGTGSISFTGGLPSGTGKVSVSYTPTGSTMAIPLTLDFSTNVTYQGTAGSLSSLSVTRQDGYAVGTLTNVAFDATGTLVLTYSNGQTVKDRQLALAMFNSEDDVESVGSNEFQAKNSANWTVGVAGSGRFGRIQSGQVEMSNVDLSQEFSNLVIMQRGYQACSQVVSTANEMLTALYGMVNK